MKQSGLAPRLALPTRGMCWFPLDAMAVKCLNSSVVPGGPNGKAIGLRCRGVLTQQRGALSIDYFSCIGVLVTYRIRHQL